MKFFLDNKGKHYFFKVNSYKDKEVLGRQLKLVYEHLQEINDPIYSDVIVEMGSVNDDFAKRKLTLLIRFLY